MIAAPAVRHVSFTGSSRVGRIIGRLAGAALKPMLLELGGNNAIVVAEVRHEQERSGEACPRDREWVCLGDAHDAASFVATNSATDCLIASSLGRSPSAFASHPTGQPNTRAILRTVSSFGFSAWPSSICHVWP